MEECQRTLPAVSSPGEEIIRPFCRPHSYSHVLVLVFKCAKIWKFIQKDVKRSGSRIEMKEICWSASFRLKMCIHWKVVKQSALLWIDKLSGYKNGKWSVKNEFKHTPSINIRIRWTAATYMLDQTRNKNPLTFLSLISILPAFLFARMERNGTERGDGKVHWITDEWEWQ